MNVWWCEEHLCGNLPNAATQGWASVPGQDGKCLFAQEFGEVACRMVEMKLTPVEQVTAPALARVDFGRKLYQEVTYDAELVRVRGEWEPDEPEGWEVFTVVLHGAEAGDFIEAKIEDLRQIVAAYDQVLIFSKWDTE